MLYEFIISTMHDAYFAQLMTIIFGDESYYILPFTFSVFFSASYSQTPSIYVFRLWCEMKFQIHTIHLVPQLCSRRKSGSGVKLTTHLHLVPRLRMRGAILPLPHTLQCVVPSSASDTTLLLQF
jgi:hypothetical protein